MKDREMLTIDSDDTHFVIVENLLCINNANDEAAGIDDKEVVIHFENGQLLINRLVLTPAMVEVVKLYLNKQI